MQDKKYKGKSSLDRNSLHRNCVLSLHRNCVLSLDQNFENHLTKFLDGFQLMESFNNDFGQTPKN
jgi:hypothetical protein